MGIKNDCVYIGRLLTFYAEVAGKNEHILIDCHMD